MHVVLLCAGEGHWCQVRQVGPRQVWDQATKGGCLGVLPRPPQRAVGQDPGGAGMLTDPHAWLYSSRVCSLVVNALVLNAWYVMQTADVDKSSV